MTQYWVLAGIVGLMGVVGSLLVLKAWRWDIFNSRAVRGSAECMALGLCGFFGIVFLGEPEDTSMRLVAGVMFFLGIPASALWAARLVMLRRTVWSKYSSGYPLGWNAPDSYIRSMEAWARKTGRFDADDPGDLEAQAGAPNKRIERTDNDGLD